MAESKPKTKSGKQPRAVGRIEWAVGALGAALTVAVLATLIHEAMTYREGAPVLVTSVIAVTQTDGGYVVRVKTENRGPSTAAEVTVSASLKRGDHEVENAEATLDYVARKSSREAGFILKNDPASGQLEIAATSYRKP